MFRPFGNFVRPFPPCQRNEAILVISQFRSKCSRQIFTKDFCLILGYLATAYRPESYAGFMDRTRFNYSAQMSTTLNSEVIPIFPGVWRFTRILEVPLFIIIITLMGTRGGCTAETSGVSAENLQIKLTVNM